MIRKMGIFLAAVFIVTGCARVQVVAPKEPIKVDIAMRLDVYQHVEKDIDAIEDIVSGKKVAGKPTSKLSFFTGTAYAADGLSDEIENAAMRRNARYGDLMAAESAGSIGENKSGLVELRGPGDASLGKLISAENSDRIIIYRSVADKNGAALGEVQKLYGKKLQASAPSGALVESPSGQWTKK